MICDEEASQKTSMSWMRRILILVKKNPGKRLDLNGAWLCCISGGCVLSRVRFCATSMEAESQKGRVTQGMYIVILYKRIDMYVLYSVFISLYFLLCHEYGKHNKSISKLAHPHGRTPRLIWPLTTPGV
jgi:hypothetical protein